MSENVRSIQAWQSLDKIIIPELDSHRLKSADNSLGLASSGGGSRAFIAAIGFLSALHKLGLIKHVDYITGISGVITIFIIC